MSTPEVSVIIPAYNSEASLAQCVDSALQQETVSLEVIIVDDGSDDGTQEVALQYGDRVKYIRQSNQGQGAARNKGLDAARGEFIAFLDADDYWLPGFLRKCVDFLREHTDAVAVSTATLFRMMNGIELLFPSCMNSPDRPDKAFMIEDFFRFWAEQDHVRTGANIIRASVIRKAGGQRSDLRISQDLEYWGYIATFGPWGIIPEPLWVGNSRASAASSGWLTKYRKRRKLCPTVESWESRIAPRLAESQKPFFYTVRGRVAAGYSQNKILGGDPDGARHIVEKYGAEMPDNRYTRLIKTGYSMGPVGWGIAWRLVHIRELLKASFVYAMSRLRPGAA